MPTLRDVADLAGVSTATVSHVVNNSRRTTPETRARVELAIAQTGFVPNPLGRLLALQKSNSAPRGFNGEALMDNTRPLVAARVISAVSPRLISVPEEEAAEGHLNLSSGSTARSLLKIVRAAQPISRADLARRLNVNRSTVTEIVKPLLASGILREGDPSHNVLGRTGRPPIGLSLRGERSFFVGVSLGVRRTQAGAATTEGQILAEDSFETPADQREAMALIRERIGKLRALLPDRELAMIAVSVPGPTDSERTRLLYAAHLGWKDVPVAEALSFKGRPSRGVQDVPVIVEGDALAAASYEARRRLKDCTDGTWNDFVLVRAGTGIGVGLVLGGEVYRGRRVGGGLAGEFGHMTIVAGGKVCACGNRGCWERYASASAASSLYIGDRPVMGRTARVFWRCCASRSGRATRAGDAGERGRVSGDWHRQCNRRSWDRARSGFRKSCARLEVYRSAP
ncbi:MAG: ROK family protein [Pyrinomonadaceae bacterium]